MTRAGPFRTDAPCMDRTVKPGTSPPIGYQGTADRAEWDSMSPGEDALCPARSRPGTRNDGARLDPIGQDGPAAGGGTTFAFSNHARLHQALGYRTPAAVYAMPVPCDLRLSLPASEG